MELCKEKQEKFIFHQSVYSSGFYIKTVAAIKTPNSISY